MGEKKKNVRTINMEINSAKREVRVTFTPQPAKHGGPDLDAYLNGLTACTHVAFVALLKELPMMRPATPAERDHHVYVFKDEIPDNAQYNARRKLHDAIAAEMNSILQDIFPDVEYIDSARRFQQETVSNMTPEEAEAHTAEIQKVVDYVRGLPDEGKNPQA